MTTTTLTREEWTAIKPRTCSVVCSDHPEWGTFGIAENDGEWLVIRSRRGDRVLHYSEAAGFWKLVTPTHGR